MSNFTFFLFFQILDMSLKTRAFKTIFILSILMVFCWLPYTTGVIVMTFYPQRDPLILLLLLWLGLAKSGLNPVVYCLRIRKFRDACRLVKSLSLTWKLHFIYPKGKFILSPRLKVSSEGLSKEIDILVRSTIQVLIEVDVVLKSKLHPVTKGCMNGRLLQISISIFLLKMEN